MLIPANGSAPQVTDSAAQLRILELVSAISSGARTITLLTQLIQSPDPKIQSKIALIVGRINRNLQWAEQHLKDPDPRVRANALEAIWGLDSDAGKALFLTASTDPDSRVSGNAAVGLYRAGDLMGAEILVSMLGSSDCRQRATAAWCITQTADPRFLPIISRHITEKDQGVRQHIFRALAGIRQRIRTARDAGQLQLLVTRTETKDGLRRVDIYASRGEQPLAGLPAVQFVLEDSGAGVNRLKLQPRRPPEHVVAGFALPRFTDREDPLTTTVAQCMRAFLVHKKKLDQWAAIRYAPPVAPAATPVTMRFESVLLAQGSGGSSSAAAVLEESAAPGAQTHVRLSTDPRVILEYAESGGTRAEAADSPYSSVKRLLEAVGIIRGQRLIYLLVRGPHDSPWMDLLPRLRDARISLSVLAAEPICPSLAALCRESGGTSFTAESLAELVPAAQRLSAATAAQYQIEYEIPADSTGAICLQLYSDLGLGEDHVVAN